MKRAPKRPFRVRYTVAKEITVWAASALDAERLVPPSYEILHRQEDVCAPVRSALARLRDAIGPWCAGFVVAVMVGGEWFCKRTGMDVRLLLFGLLVAVPFAFEWARSRW